MQCIFGAQTFPSNYRFCYGACSIIWSLFLRFLPPWASPWFPNARIVPLWTRSNITFVIVPWPFDQLWSFAAAYFDLPAFSDLSLWCRFESCCDSADHLVCLLLPIICWLLWKCYNTATFQSQGQLSPLIAGFVGLLQMFTMLKPLLVRAKSWLSCSRLHVKAMRLQSFPVSVLAAGVEAECGWLL